MEYTSNTTTLPPDTTTVTAMMTIVQVSWFYSVFYDDWSAMVFAVLIVFLSVTAMLGVYWYPRRSIPYNQVPTGPIRV
jgi:predicted RND superfamily exporter protein